MKKNKMFLKAILLLIGAILFPIFILFVDLVVGLYVGFYRPDLTYDGDKSVPEEDVIRYGKITLRDLRLDIVYTVDYGNGKECHKYFIVK